MNDQFTRGILHEKSSGVSEGRQIWVYEKDEVHEVGQ